MSEWVGLFIANEAFIALNSWLIGMWQFQIFVKNEVTIDASGVKPYRANKFLFADYVSYGVGSALLVLRSDGKPQPTISRTSNDMGSCAFFINKTLHLILPGSED